VKPTQYPVFGFTTKASQRVRELRNQIEVSEAFDPRASNDPASMPVRKQYEAVWDTGATGTVITSKVVTELGLQPSGKVTVQGVGQAGTPSQHLCNTYLVNLYLPNKTIVSGVRVSENSLAGCDVLIGMDVICNGDFAVTNEGGKTTWTFRMPACEEIDFVQEIERYKQKYGEWKPPVSADEQRRMKNKQKAERRKNR
jgi:hypothetical protein